MLTRRIIPCLDVKDGRVVKGVRFEALRDAGDPVQAARAYGEAGADELFFLDISASLESRGTMVALVERVARQLAIPFAVGGGVRSAADAEPLLRAGADKVSLNTAALAEPALITAAAKLAGSQRLRLASHDMAGWRGGELAGSVFHFGTLSIHTVKEACAARGFPMGLGLQTRSSTVRTAWLQPSSRTRPAARS